MSTVINDAKSKNLLITRPESFSLAVYSNKVGEGFDDSLYLDWTPDQLRQLADKIYELYPMPEPVTP